MRRAGRVSRAPVRRTAWSLLFPSWWYGCPRSCKGYFDRVWLPGVAFEYGPQAIRPLLTGIRAFGAVDHHRRSGVVHTRLHGQSVAKVLMRGLARLLVARNAERFWLALYGMENATRQTRGSSTVRQRISQMGRHIRDRRYLPAPVRLIVRVLSSRERLCRPCDSSVALFLSGRRPSRARASACARGARARIAGFTLLRYFEVRS